MKRNSLEIGLSQILIPMFRCCESVPIQRAVFLVAGTLLCFSLSGGSIEATNINLQHADTPTNTDFQLPSNDTSALRTPSAGIIGIKYIRLYPHGFEPQKITSMEGPFLLAVDNRSGFIKGEITFRLDKVGANRIREARLPVRKRGWRERIDLAPGTYLLTEINHPQWKCEITIVSR